jgi:dsDNA-specific endonuclease/ATPase MutS2
MYQKVEEKKSRPLVTPARKEGEPIVVDLHADEVLETTTGMNATDILNYQLDVMRKTLKENAKKKGTKIIFIHGKGEGVLRQALVNELRFRFKSYTYQDASFQEYGYGATLVTIR